MAYAEEVITASDEMFANSLGLLRTVEAGGLMSVDTESSGFSARLGARVTVVSLAWREADGRGHAIALPFGQGQGRDKVWASEGAWGLVLEALAKRDLVMFNSHFDRGMLRAGNQRDGGADFAHRIHWDGMVAEKAIIGGSTGGLKETAERYGLTGGGEREGEEALMRWLYARGMSRGDMHKVPWAVMRPYARQDAVLTLRLYEAQQKRLEQLPAGVVAKVEEKMRALRERFLDSLPLAVA